MHLLCLIVSCGFSGSDGPYRLVSENDFAEFFSVKVEEAFLDLGFYYFEEATVFALFENFTDAKMGVRLLSRARRTFSRRVSEVSP